MSPAPIFKMDKAQASGSCAVAPSVEKPQLPPFAEKLLHTVNGGACCLGLSLGSELGLFKALSSFEKPASSAAIASEAKLNER